MTGRLHQLNIEYDAVEDRLVLKANTTDKQEFRLWLTRRFTQQLWDSLMQIMQEDPEVKRVSDKEARKAMVAFQRQKALKPEQFEKSYAADADAYPLGEKPVLLTGFGYSPEGSGGMPRLSFKTASGHEIGLPVSGQILHSLAKLIEQVMPATGWGLSLEIGYRTDEAGYKPDASKVH